MMTRVAFLMIAGIAVAAALGLVLRRNAIHGALFLVMNLGCVAALYLMLGAEFLAAAQVIVYAGAIMVLFVFAIMVLIPGKEETGPDARKAWRLLAAPLGGALLLELVLLVSSRAAAPVPTQTTPSGSVATIGRLLFTDYLLPFELTSVLLLAAMVGVLLLARSQDGRAAPQGYGPDAGVRKRPGPQRAEHEASLRGSPMPQRAEAEVSMRESAKPQGGPPEASPRGSAKPRGAEREARR